MITPELHARVNATVQSCIKKIFGQSYELNVPVTYRKDMKKVAGMAYYGTKKIELNETLFLQNIDQFFARTIPHEAAHLITKILFPRAKQGHGPEWRQVMARLGVENVARCHSYDVSSVSKVRVMERFTYVCACERSLNLSKIMHNKIQNGSHRACKTCRTRIIFSPK